MSNEKIRKLWKNIEAKLKPSAIVILLVVAGISTIFMLTGTFISTVKGAEDYTTFTEYDPLSQISVASSTQLDITCDATRTAWLYKNYTAGYFDNFVIDFDVNWVSSTSKNAGLYCFCLGDNISDWNAQATDKNSPFIYVNFWSNDAPENRIYLATCPGDGTSSANWTTIDLNTLKYYTVARNDTNVSLNVYNDSARTILDFSLHANYVSNTFKTLWAVASANASNAAAGVWDINNLTIISTGSTSTYTLKGLSSPYSITWDGTAGDTVWCNTSGSGYEWMEINMSINATDNVTEIRIYVADLNDTSAWINASNITMYISSDNVSANYSSMGTFNDGGSNISINITTWPAGAGTNPFNGAGLTDKDVSIYCLFRLKIPVGSPTDNFYSLTTDAWKVYLGYYA